MNLATAVYKTVHRNKLSVEELADLIGLPDVSMLYRASNPNDEKVDLKLHWLVPLMNATKDYSILHQVANLLGFVCVKVPRARAMKPGEIAAHQLTLSKYLHGLFQFEKGEISREEALALCEQALTEVAGARKMVERSSAQQELDLEEGA